MSDRDGILEREQVAGILGVYPHLELFVRSHEALREKASHLERALGELSLAAVRYRGEENKIRGRLLDEAVDHATTVLCNERQSRPGTEQ